MWSIKGVILAKLSACEDSPDGYPQTQAYVWWNYHDLYTDDAAPWRVDVVRGDGTRERITIGPAD